MDGRSTSDPSSAAETPPAGAESGSDASPNPLANPLDGRAARAERRRQERRLAILAAAKLVFREKGYHQASVHDIIDEARIARGTFYLYFASKQEIFGELASEFLRTVRAQVHKISLDAGMASPRIQLRDNFRRVVAAVLQHADVASIILRDPTSFDPDSQGRVNVFFDQVIGLIEGAILVGQRLSLVGPCDKHVVAVTALGGVRATLVRLLDANTAEVAESPQHRSFSDPDHVADELLAFFLKGLSGPPVS